MNLTPRQMHAYCDQFAQLHDDELSTAEQDALQNRLLADRDVRRLYLRYMRVCAGLSWDLKDSADEVLPEEAKAAECRPPRGPATDVAGVCDPGIRSANQPVELPTDNVRKPTPTLSWLSRAANRVPGGEFTVGTLIVLVVATAFWGLATQFYYPRLARQVEAGDAGNPTEVARIEATSAASWSKPHLAKSADASVANGEPLEIRSGFVRLRLKQGVSLIVEGPARWSIDGANQATLHAGKLVARVPTNAIGFHLDTPGGRIIDLGTEFGVTVAENCEAEVQVFVGKIAVRPNASATQGAETRVLSAGETARIVRGNQPDDFAVSDVVGKPAKLARQLPPSSSRLAAPQFPPSLIAYWNFDEQNEEGIAWDVRGNNHATLVDVERVAGLAGRGAVQFSNTAGQVVRLPAQPSGLNFAEGITIELLFTSNWSGAPLDYDELVRKEGSFTFSFQNDPNDAVDGPVLSLEVRTNMGSANLDMPLDGQEGRPTLAELTDGKPHHAVATGNATTGEFAIHVDGKKCVSQIIAPGAAVVVGGNATPLIGNYSGNLEEPFSGVIDEVALYSSSMSAEQIADHWANSRNQLSYFSSPVARPLKTTR